MKNNINLETNNNTHIMNLTTFNSGARNTAGAVHNKKRKKGSLTSSSAAYPVANGANNGVELEENNNIKDDEIDAKDIKDLSLKRCEELRDNENTDALKMTSIDTDGGEHKSKSASSEKKSGSAISGIICTLKNNLAKNNCDSKNLIKNCDSKLACGYAKTVDRGSDVTALKDSCENVGSNNDNHEEDLEDIIKANTVRHCKESAGPKIGVKSIETFAVTMKQKELIESVALHVETEQNCDKNKPGTNSTSTETTVDKNIKCTMDDISNLERYHKMVGTATTPSRINEVVKTDSSKTAINSNETKNELNSKHSIVSIDHILSRANHVETNLPKRIDSNTNAQIHSNRSDFKRNETNVASNRTDLKRKIVDEYEFTDDETGPDENQASREKYGLFNGALKRIEKRKDISLRVGDMVRIDNSDKNDKRVNDFVTKTFTDQGNTLDPTRENATSKPLHSTSIKNEFHPKPETKLGVNPVNGIAITDKNSHAHNNDVTNALNIQTGAFHIPMAASQTCKQKTTQSLTKFRKIFHSKNNTSLPTSTVSANNMSSSLSKIDKICDKLSKSSTVISSSQEIAVQKKTLPSNVIEDVKANIIDDIKLKDVCNNDKRNEKINDFNDTGNFVKTESEKAIIDCKDLDKNIDNSTLNTCKDKSDDANEKLIKHSEEAKEIDDTKERRHEEVMEVDYKHTKDVKLNGINENIDGKEANIGEIKKSVETPNGESHSDTNITKTVVKDESFEIKSEIGDSAERNLPEDNKEDVSNEENTEARNLLKEDEDKQNETDDSRKKTDTTANLVQSKTVNISSLYFHCYSYI
uniref:Uncharacterized protein n=1 Tax=Cacopsylla melanoneura TaxID=428564 RepID=A0A8D8X7M3_9HEMI